MAESPSHRDHQSFSSKLMYDSNSRMNQASTATIAFEGRPEPINEDPQRCRAEYMGKRLIGNVRDNQGVWHLRMI